MADPDFLRSPFDVVADLLGVALNPQSTAEERVAACDQLKSLSTQFLRELALDGDWKFVLGALGRDDLGEVAGEMPGDGPWSTPAGPPMDAPPAEEVAPPPAAASAAPAGPTASTPSTAQPILRPVLCLYSLDLRHLIGDDFQETPRVVSWPLVGEASPVDRIAYCARAAAMPPEATELYVRTLPWTLLNHGTALIRIGQRWPGRTDLLQAFWAEVLERRVGGGVPFRLATAIDRILVERPHHRDWFDEVAHWIEAYVDRELFDFYNVDDLAAKHFDLRLGVADWVRRTEMTDPMTISAAELYASARLLRGAAALDLARAWHDGGGTPEGALAAYDRANQENDILFEKTVRATLRHPTSAMVDGTAPGLRQSMNLIRQLREPLPDLAERGFLWAEQQRRRQPNPPPRGA